MDTRRFTRASCLILLLSACTDGLAQAPTDVLLGDVTGNGVVSVIDAQQVARYSDGLPVIYPIGEPICGHLSGDVDGDGGVDMDDAVAIAEYAVGLDVPYPIGEAVSCSTR